MKPIHKVKIEAYLADFVKIKFVEICRTKGISLADGIRRAIEEWSKHESNNKPN